MKFQLIDNAARDWHRLWTVRISLGSVLFWGAISGLWLVWPALAGAIPLWFYALGGVAMGVLLAFARVTKQPGLEQ